MNQLQTFSSDLFGSVRAVEIAGEAWLVGKDVAERLGYSNASKAVMAHVDNEDKRFEMLPTPDSQNGNLIKTALINESGLYALVLRSKLPEAKKFRRWVTSEVLPAIRRHGVYATAETAERLMNDPDFMIRTFTALKEERERRQALEIENRAMQPKALFADAVAASDATILIGDLAKILKQNGIDIGQRRLFAYLRDNGFLIRRKGADWNSPTQRAMEMGLFQIKETAITHSDGHVSVNKTTKVTGKGQQYFVNLFLAKEEK